MAATPSFWTLRFTDTRAEIGFLKFKERQLCGSIFVSAIMVTVMCLGGIVTSFTTYAVHRDSGALLVQCSVLGFGILLCLAGMLTVRSQRFLALVGPIGLELCICGVLITAIWLTIFLIPFHLFKMTGFGDVKDDPYFSMRDDTFFALILTAYIFGSHIILRVRWVCMWPSEVVGVIAYSLPTLMWSGWGPTAKLLRILLMCALTLASAFGTRSIERYERAAFAQLAAEKTMRVQAEHQLEVRTPPSSGPTTPQNNDANSSLPETTNTGELFKVIQAGISAMPWQQLIKLGTDEHWLVPGCDLHLQHVALGTGSFGMVLPAKYHGATVAVKAPRSSANATSAKHLASVAHEIRIFRHLRHPNIVLFYGACVEPISNELVLVLELVRGTHLQAFVALPPSGPSTAERCKLADDVCCALRYLHGQTPRIVHGDLKGSNVLVERSASDVHAKLVDFGLSRVMTKNALPLGGTLIWMAPEVMLKQSPSHTSDVFSFGRLLYMVMTGLQPLRGVLASDIVRSAQDGTVCALVWPQTVPLRGECQALCSRCLQRAPERRPSMLEVHAALQQWPAGDLARTREGGAEAREGAIRVLPPLPPQPLPPQPSEGLGAALQRARLALEAEGMTPLEAAQLPRTACADGEGRSRSSGSASGNGSSYGGVVLVEADASSCSVSGEQGSATAGALAVPHFQATPDTMKDFTTVAMLLSWNIAVDAPGLCCNYHAAVAELQQVHARLQARPCVRQFAPHADWQCPRCRLLGATSGDGQKTKCERCGYEGRLTGVHVLASGNSSEVEPPLQVWRRSAHL